ncbi:VCBS repeat-containing protein [Spirosoma sp. BT702]|uniref:VCBS repeat-containing protein n=1 Tax=Spirosoma profusum TaxID=2771354 RepID=A0A926Y0R6_9BACT|nr:VCBS repeat-containing protein [Spirosoma profusum]MBD2699666.1 VCBS repeat-containing protein [Spirosoma profusum]
MTLSFTYLRTTNPGLHIQRQLPIGQVSRFGRLLRNHPLLWMLFCLLCSAGTTWSQCFTVSSTIAVGSSPVHIVMADLNADGKLDMVNGYYGIIT